ncbi:uncharacterized protein LOC143036291 [Oratosquilla oratoria]|uniref:uncharacterized protein LOC143036291 n=1 Tax=Oratosquilla oratoria TaxID=337810 RepID=UPI003F772A24
MGVTLQSFNVPQYKFRGETAELFCNYNPGNRTLYSVNWFKDDNEIFRYVPGKEKEQQHHFYDRLGVHIDKNLTVPKKVVLRGVDFDTSGEYRCDVSAEGPDFYTVSGSATMIVVELPSTGPFINGGRSQYHVNDTVDLNCTSGPSRPPAGLSWFLNGEEMEDEFTTQKLMQDSRDGLMTRTSRLTFVAKPWHFHRGMMTLKCKATVATRYPDPAREYIPKVLASPSTTPHILKTLEEFFQATASAPPSLVSCSPMHVFLLPAALLLLTHILLLSHLAPTALAEHLLFARSSLLLASQSVTWPVSAPQLTHPPLVRGRSPTRSRDQ